MVEHRSIFKKESLIEVQVLFGIGSPFGGMAGFYSGACDIILIFYDNKCIYGAELKGKFSYLFCFHKSVVRDPLGVFESVMVAAKGKQGSWFGRFL